MSINFDAIKADLERLNKKTRSKDGNEDLFWKPTGEHVIRIVPYAHDRADSFRRFLFHYNISQKPIVSPATFGNDDPVLEYARKLQNSGDTEKWKLGKNLEPKMRVFAPIIVRGEESKGVRFYGFTENVYLKIAKFISSGDYGDISDLEKGHDIAIEYIKKPGGYPETNILVKPIPTPAFNDSSLLSKIDEVPELENIFRAPSKEELVSIFEEYMSPTNANNESNGAETSNTTTTSDSTSVPNNVKSAMDSFDSLFNS
jgi:hypothetical protein